MNFIEKLLHIPTPKELGKSDCNALPSALLSSLFPDEVQDKYTWEDYDVEMSAKYPVKWFLTRTIPKWWRRWLWGTYSPAQRLIWWFDDNLIKRYHVLSLVQPGPDGYKRGWLSAKEQLLYANFNILMNYYNTEFKQWAQDDEDQEFVPVVKELVKYWTVDRAEWNKEYSLLSTQAYQTRDHEEKYKLYNELHQRQLQFEQLETKMLIKLIDIRYQM